MTTPTASIPSWGTAATVTTGPDTGLSTRLEPDAAAKAAGYIADRAIAARVDNWRAGSVGDWLGYLAPVQIRNWQPYTRRVIATGYTAVYLNTTAVFTDAGWLVPGSAVVSAVANATIYRWPAPQNEWNEASESSRTQFPDDMAIISIARAPYGTCVLGCLRQVGATDTTVWTVFEDGVTGLSEKTLSASAGGAGRVVYEETTNRFLAFDHRAGGWVNGGVYYVSTDGGVTWTSRTIASSGSARTIQNVFAAGGSIYITYANTNAIRVSSDGGETWLALGTTGTAGVVGICSTANGMMAIDNTGQVYRRFGDLWLPAGSPLAGVTFGESDNVAQSGNVFYGNHMASDGARAVVVPFGESGRGYGYYWSLDYGVTWHKEFLGLSTSTTHIVVRGVAYGGGEFLLIVQSPNQDDSSAGYEIWHSLRL